MSTRAVERIIPAVKASDGAGVRLMRSLGQSPHTRLDPFLMFDEFGSDQPEDYRGGFPPHPHRGFETVTYMMAGRMRHRDHMDNEGIIGPGDVQWMTAGRGVIHEEMPEQEEGLMRGFQLWINLPAAEKMKPAAYRDIPAGQIPRASPAPGVEVRIIAGQIEVAGTPVTGPIHGLSTDPLYLDIELGADAGFTLPLADERNAFVYPFDGNVRVGDSHLDRRHLGILGSGGELSLKAGPDGARVLLLAARPIGEPVAQWGPFVMNNREEIEQALADYRAGTLAEPA